MVWDATSAGAFGLLLGHPIPSKVATKVPEPLACAYAPVPEVTVGARLGERDRHPGRLGMTLVKALMQNDERAVWKANRSVLFPSLTA